MTDFKLLAIRPLKGCHRRFAKNLTLGRIYSIYNGYTYYNSSNEKIRDISDEQVSSIRKVSNFPTKIYNKNSADGKPLEISVSAIAGKNGAGKSTLVELLFSCIYLHCVNLDILQPSINGLNKLSLELENEKAGFIEREKAIAAYKRSIRKSIADSDKIDVAFVDGIKGKFEALSRDEQDLKDRKQFVNEELKRNSVREKEINSFVKDLKAEIYFELNGRYYRLKLNPESLMAKDTKPDAISYVKNGDKTNQKTLTTTIDEKNLSQHFFYTIAVNYSHYALNAFHIGEWINSLFHKNDGYTAPIVINPMRTDGNFNINSEMNFARYRLLSNKLQEWKRSDVGEKVFVSDNRFISRVIFKVNRDKVATITINLRIRNGIIRGNIREVNMFTTFIAQYLDTAEEAALLTKDFALKEIIINYIVKKLDTIPKRYPWFGMGYQFGENTPFVLNEKFFQDIFEDGSHITYKLKQAVHFLKYCLNTNEERMFNVKKPQLQGEYGITFRYSLNEVFDWSNATSGLTIMTTLPPSIFDIDFELSNEKNVLSNFTALSSGEQQLIHTVQSVIYHINNLQSAHLGKGKRTKYSAINVIYDEIELYFHPEYQRRFVNRLLTEFTRFYQNGRTNITAINVLLLTHSPFILSDIPRENILLLEPASGTGRTISKVPSSQTFAANINDLLADGFFLTGTLMGEFAENEIKEAIERVRNRTATEDDGRLLENVGDAFLRYSLENFKNRQHD
ncbi:hypothetical protein SAMN04488511_101167 [Pedobacter suwonensis]|uniref:AAA domain-containing protein, AbiEii toxin, Type IV TA system n=1 Tax=Pedobacter suwonensis TaxID=332999 RepID=A0A1I0SFJ3_9SPHI|nr:ATP-binding protein [Pedobacter suwonensis]SFA38291.1 hypothetical protein SAMN04488511_101167 [Pedobacter suwonensis]